MTTLSKIRNPIATRLLAWFDAEKRDMPWRNSRDPYAIWLSETMLQQTQVETVKPYYHKFLRRFPTVADLAGARLEEVLEMWAGLGYYRRAKNLHLAAKMMVERGGTVPGSAAQLVELPGVGRYTAAAVASIAFGEAAVVLDGNVARVLARLTALREPINVPQVQKKLWVMAETLMAAPAATARAGDFNQAMMELGAVICTPKSPQCVRCPLAGAFCEAQKRGLQASMPLRTPKSVVRTLERVAVVLSRGAGARRRFLILQRPAGGLWEGMWEFPTFEGRPENLRLHRATKRPLPSSPGPLPSSALLNWTLQITDVLRERFGLAATLDFWRGDVVHKLTHRTLETAIARGQLKGRKAAPALAACDQGHYQAARWVTLEELRSMAVARMTWRVAEAAGLT